MITIGINGNEANVPHRVGVGQYAFALLQGLSKHTEVNFRIFLENTPLPDLPPSSPHWHYEVLGSSPFWTLTKLGPKLWFDRNLDLLFSPSHYNPLFIPVPSVISIMDMSFETLPETFKKKDLFQLRYWTKVSALQARKVLTISQFSRSEILRLYHLPPEKVVAIPLGYTSSRFYKGVKPDPRVLKKYQLPPNYLVFLGTLQPKKNLVRLLEAFAALDPALSLVIVGMKNEGRGGWLFEEFFQTMDSLHLHRRVITTGYVPDEEVPTIYAGAKAFVLPSIYEGFGIPALEAMAVGVPVIVSHVASLPEVCGEAAWYIDNPYSVPSIKSTLEEFLHAEPAVIQKKVNLGLSRVKGYNWETTAERTLDVLKSISHDH